MMSSRLSFVMICGAIIMLATQLVSAAPNKQLVSIEIRSPKVAVNSGDAVQIDIIIKNISNQEIQILDDSAPETHYTVDLRDARHNSVPATDIGDKIKDSHTGKAGAMIVLRNAVAVNLLKPGESYTENLVVSDLFDMKQLGKYTIQLSENDTGAKSNLIKISVVK